MARLTLLPRRRAGVVLVWWCSCPARVRVRAGGVGRRPGRCYSAAGTSATMRMMYAGVVTVAFWLSGLRLHTPPVPMHTTSICPDWRIRKPLLVKLGSLVRTASPDATYQLSALTARSEPEIAAFSAIWTVGMSRHIGQASGPAVLRR